MNIPDKEFAQKGSRIIDSSHNAVSGSFYMLRVLKDSVFSVLKKKEIVGSNGVATEAADCTAENGVAAALSVSAGAVLTVADNYLYTDITLTSGQVNAFNA